jgi:transposase-like protein
VPRPHPPEFRRRAVELANQRDGQGKRLQPVAQTAAELGISDSCLRNWIAKVAVDVGQHPGLSSDEGRELVEPRRSNRVLETENEILTRAAAYFARENVCPE